MTRFSRLPAINPRSYPQILLITVKIPALKLVAVQSGFHNIGSASIPAKPGDNTVGLILVLDEFGGLSTALQKGSA
ncbi:MAG: hypothetical protein H6978_10215 [Gammaproteobacteria bacterium]|nr:hypothetical protein [Gammaproteobacteria bacterium]